MLRPEVCASLNNDTAETVSGKPLNGKPLPQCLAHRSGLLCSQPLPCMLSCFSRVQLFATLWAVAHQAPLSKGFSRQEHCSRLPCPPPAALPEPGIEPLSPASPALQVNFSPAEPPKVMIFLPTEPPKVVYQYVSSSCLLCVLHHHDSFT